MMTVKELANLTGTSVRTLQYYDKVGLLPPAAYTDAGYRLYNEQSLEHLHQILLYRELEFPLSKIKAIMASEDFDRYEVLDQQIEMLKAKKARLENLILFARGIKFSGGGKYIMSGIRAKYIPRIDLHDPVELKEAIPLRTPYVIYIDPCDTCNFRCKFCPTGNLDLMRKTPGRDHGPMSMTLYKEIIDSLSEFKDPIRVIRLYKEGEPLLNPHFAEMVRYAKASPKVLRVDTTTNGALLTPERSLEIINAGLDRINISVEGMNAQQYKEFSGINLDYEKYVENISFFYAHRNQCEVNIKICGDNLTQEQEEQFYNTFGNIADGISVERTIEYWPKYQEMGVDVDESVTLLGGKSREVMVCPYVFYEMCINSNGTYSLCRFDWNHAMIMGKEFAGKVTPKQVWDSITLWTFQSKFLNKERKLMPMLSCPKCGILKQGVPEDIDKYVDEILDKM